MMTTAPPLTRPANERARRSGLLLALLALAGSLFVITPMALLSLRQEAESVQSGPAITVPVAADGMRFEPNEIRVPAGANVRIDFSNQDRSGTPHDFQTTGQRRNARVVAWPGETRALVFKAADTPGRYAFICTVRGHSAAGMTGVIVVE